MQPSGQRSQVGFTLVEIMIVVAIIGLLAALPVPGFIRSRMRAQAERCVNDCRILDHAIDQWALETGAKKGDFIDYDAISRYVKGNVPWVDPLGDPYLFWEVGGTQVCIDPFTTSQLNGLGIDWGPYNPWGGLMIE